MTGTLWLEDVHVGNRFRTDTYDLTADAIIEFATEWDPQPFHLGEDAAQDTFFKGLVPRRQVRSIRSVISELLG